VFTARYGLNPCIIQTQVRFFFKRLIKISHVLRTSILVEFPKLEICFDSENIVCFKKFTHLYFMFGVRTRDRSVRDLIRNQQQTFLTQSTRMYVHIRSCNNTHRKNIAAHLKTKILDIYSTIKWAMNAGINYYS